MNDTKNDWYGTTLETDGTPMVNDNTGHPLILKTFEFAFNPELKQIPSKQMLFNAHWPYMQTMIKIDNLVPNTDVNPRVIIGKYRYRIFILCEPITRRGIKIVPGKPKTLQDLFDKRKT